MKQLTIATAVVIATAGCGRQTETPSQKAGSAAPVELPPVISDSPSGPSIRFSEVAGEVGIDFTYYGSPSERLDMVEQNGGGIALADFHNSGRLDVYLVNGSNFGSPAKGKEQSSRMFHAVGLLEYEDCTEPAGLIAHGFGMGCAAGDYDNDGFIDLFVACYGRNRLYRNNGDGTFSQVDAFAGVDDDRWAASAAFADLNDDGALDLYVVNYVQWDESDPPCYTQHDPPIHITCGPIGRAAQPDLLFENLGDGSFREIGTQAGIADENGKGLALQIADLDGDGRLDVYVANDTTPNNLYRNLGGMRFEDIALNSGAATGADGKAHAGMGVGCGDYNGNGRLDLCVTNFENEPNDFYENLGDRGFLNVNARLGMDSVSRPALSFGIVMADFNLDGSPDLFVSNGHIWNLTSLGVGYSYAMRPHLWQNDRGERFHDVSENGGEYFQKEWLGRAAAAGDLDNDGDPDLVVMHLENPVAVLRNDSPRQGKSLRLHLVGKRSARQPLGATVMATLDNKERASVVPAGGSFQASSDPTVLIPLGDASKPERLTIRWSHSSVTTVTDFGDALELIVVEE